MTHFSSCRKRMNHRSRPWNSCREWFRKLITMSKFKFLLVSVSCRNNLKRRELGSIFVSQTNEEQVAHPEPYTYNILVCNINGNVPVTNSTTLQDGYSISFILVQVKWYIHRSCAIQHAHLSIVRHADMLQYPSILIHGLPYCFVSCHHHHV